MRNQERGTRIFISSFLVPLSSFLLIDNRYTQRKFERTLMFMAAQRPAFLRLLFEVGELHCPERGEIVSVRIVRPHDVV